MNGSYFPVHLILIAAKRTEVQDRKFEDRSFDHLNKDAFLFMIRVSFLLLHFMVQDRIFFPIKGDCWRTMEDVQDYQVHIQFYFIIWNFQLLVISSENSFYQSFGSISYLVGVCCLGTLFPIPILFSILLMLLVFV